MPRKPCKVQCPQCPFRANSLPGWLGDYTPQTVFQSAWFNQPFYCHTKIRYEDPDWAAKAQANGRVCLGSLAFANRIMAPKRADERFDADDQLEIIRMRGGIEGREGIDCMDARTFGQRHDPDKRAENMATFKPSTDHLSLST